MGPAVLAKPLLPDAPGGRRKCRPQPLIHPRMETYPESLLKELSTYCYTCESRAVGAEALLHLYFGELGCNHCYHNIKSCSDFRTRYPMIGLCKGSGEDHNACRWVAPTCKYVMYNTRKTLSIAHCINNKFEKQEVFREATAYLRALLPLRGLYPWRSALKTIAKAGIAVDLSNCPPRLLPLDPLEGGRAVTKAMVGVSGLLNLEKSIIHLEKRKKLKDRPARMQNTPGSTWNTSANTHNIHANTENTHSSTDHPSTVYSTSAVTESSHVCEETLQKPLNKTKRNSRTSTECNILAGKENSSNIQTQHSLHEEGKSRNTDTNTENPLPSIQTPPIKTENSPVSIETPHEFHKKDVVEKNSVYIQPLNYLPETPKPLSQGSVTSQNTGPDLKLRKRKKRMADASAENFPEERKEVELKDMFTSVAKTAVTCQGTLHPRAKKRKLEVSSTTKTDTALTHQDSLPSTAKKKKKIKVPSTSTENSVLTHQHSLPSSTGEKEKTQLKHTFANMEANAVTTQNTFPVIAEKAVEKKHKKKTRNSLRVRNNPGSAEDVPNDASSVCVENTASRQQRKRKVESLDDTFPPSANFSPKTHKRRKQKNSNEVKLEATSAQDIKNGKAESVDGSEPPGATAVLFDHTLPTRVHISPKTHKKRKQKNPHEEEFEATNVQDVSLDNPKLGSEESSISKKHKRKKLKGCDDVKLKGVGAREPFPVTSLPSGAENTTSKNHKKMDLKSHAVESEAAPKQRRRKVNSTNVERESLGNYSALCDTLNTSGCVDDIP